MISFARWLALVILVAVTPLFAAAQEVDVVLSQAAAAMGTTSVKKLRFSVSGSGYEIGQNADPSSWRHVQFKSETWEIDVDLPSFVKGDHRIDLNSPWEEQFQIWATPQGFLKGAFKTNAFLGEWKKGDELYNLVIFKVGEKLVSGYFNSRGLLEIVETRIQHPILGDTLVQTVYSEYKDFGSLKFPTTIIQKLGGALTSVLIVSGVQGN